jgi:hypothetical protein
VRNGTARNVLQTQNIVFSLSLAVFVEESNQSETGPTN